MVCKCMTSRMRRTVSTNKISLITTTTPSYDKLWYPSYYGVQNFNPDQSLIKEPSRLVKDELWRKSHWSQCDVKIKDVGFPCQMSQNTLDIHRRLAAGTLLIKVKKYFPYWYMFFFLLTKIPDSHLGNFFFSKILIQPKLTSTSWLRTYYNL